MAPHLSESIRLRRLIRRVVYSILIIVGGTFTLVWSLCSPLDVTDNSAQNGGFSRGRVFVLQVPIYVSNEQYAVPASTPRYVGDVLIPAGCQLEILKVTYIREIVADNIFRYQPLARWKDGPLTGKEVYLQNISRRNTVRQTEIDPAFLAPLTPAATTTAS